MDPKEVEGVVCELCGIVMQATKKDLETRYMCSECDELYETEQEAKECCCPNA